VRMRSTRKSTVNPCASMIASLQPSGTPRAVRARGGARASGRACGVNRLSASRPFCSGGGPARWVVSCAYIRQTPWPSKTRIQRST
jgi:hypothetical protein